MQDRRAKRSLFCVVLSGNSLLTLLSIQSSEFITMAIKFRVLIEQDEDGIYVAEVPTLPGCITQGATRDEALTNVRQAIELYLESLEKHGDPIPPSITEEIVEIEL